MQVKIDVNMEKNWKGNEVHLLLKVQAAKHRVYPQNNVMASKLNCYFTSKKVRQSRYTPWRRLGEKEV
jgi:hypothetical protein